MDVLLNRVNGSECFIGWQACVEQEWVESSCRTMVDLFTNHVLWVFHDRCHILRQGRLHLGSENMGLAHVMQSLKCHVGTRTYVG